MYDAAQMKQEMEAISRLGAAMLLQATKDYLKAKPENKKVILKDLKGKWCNFLTDEKASDVAEQLVARPAEIQKRLKKGMKGCKN